jgi:hypothetical protein
MTEALVAGAAVTLIAALFLFAFASLLKDQSIMDIAYGLVFVLLAWTLAYYFSALEVPMMLMLLAVSLWGVRLAARIFLKNYGKPEDFRYKHLRDKWSVGGKLNFYLKSLTDVFLLQGLIIFIVASGRYGYAYCHYFDRFVFDCFTIFTRYCRDGRDKLLKGKLDIAFKQRSLFRRERLLIVSGIFELAGTETIPSVAFFLY